MNEQYSEWQKPYQEALIEVDKTKLEQKIQIAEWQIFKRLQQLSNDSNHLEERHAIADALNALRSLKREILAA